MENNKSSAKTEDFVYDAPQFHDFEKDGDNLSVSSDFFSESHPQHFPTGNDPELGQSNLQKSEEIKENPNEKKEYYSPRNFSQWLDKPFFSSSSSTKK